MLCGKQPFSVVTGGDFSPCFQAVLLSVPSVLFIPSGLLCLYSTLRSPRGGVKPTKQTLLLSVRMICCTLLTFFPLLLAIIYQIQGLSFPLFFIQCAFQLIAWWISLYLTILEVRQLCFWRRALRIFWALDTIAAVKEMESAFVGTNPSSLALFFHGVRSLLGFLTLATCGVDSSGRSGPTAPRPHIMWWLALDSGWELSQAGIDRVLGGSANRVQRYLDPYSFRSMFSVGSVRFPIRSIAQRWGEQTSSANASGKGRDSGSGGGGGGGAPKTHRVTRGGTVGGGKSGTLSSDPGRALNQPLLTADYAEGDADTARELGTFRGGGFRVPNSPEGVNGDGKGNGNGGIDLHTESVSASVAAGTNPFLNPSALNNGRQLTQGGKPSYSKTSSLSMPSRGPANSRQQSRSVAGALSPHGPLSVVVISWHIQGYSSHQWDEADEAHQAYKARLAHEARAAARAAGSGGRPTEPGRKRPMPPGSREVSVKEGGKGSVWSASGPVVPAEAKGGPCFGAAKMLQFITFTILVKWDKRTVFTVTRRYADFVLLRTLLTRSDPSLDSSKLARSGKTSSCGWTRSEPLFLHRRVQVLNSFLQQVLSSSKKKDKRDKDRDSVLACFLLQGHTLMPDATFNTRLTKDDFEVLKVVGKGSFGKVFQVRKKDTDKIYAMKVLKKRGLSKPSQIAHTKTEREVMARIHHPFIVSLRFAFQTRSRLYMVLDYFSGGELFFHLNKGRFTEERTRFYIAEIVLALDCLHSAGIAYRDLKPENILLDHEGHVRLTDFGLSKSSISGSNAVTHTFCGTAQYLAPEIIEGAGYGKGVDWWALGTLMFELLTAHPPFTSKNMKRLYEQILRSAVRYPAYMSDQAKDLISKLLTRDPKLRAGCNGAGEIKRHPFFQSIDWERLYHKDLPVPFKPTNTEGERDVTNVWPEFKQELPQYTPVVESALNKNFSHFTYIQDGEGEDDNYDEEALFSPIEGGSALQESSNPNNPFANSKDNGGVRPGITLGAGPGRDSPTARSRHGTAFGIGAGPGRDSPTARSRHGTAFGFGAGPVGLPPTAAEVDPSVAVPLRKMSHLGLGAIPAVAGNNRVEQSDDDDIEDDDDDDLGVEQEGGGGDLNSDESFMDDMGIPDAVRAGGIEDEEDEDARISVAGSQVLLTAGNHNNNKTNNGVILQSDNRRGESFSQYSEEDGREDQEEQYQHQNQQRPSSISPPNVGSTRDLKMHVINN